MKRLAVVDKSAEPSEETDRWKQKVDPESLKVVTAANAALTFHNFSNTISPSSFLSAHSTDVNWAMLSTQSCCLIPGSDYTDFSVWLSDKMTRHIAYWMIIACLLSWTVWSHQEGVAEIKTRIYKQCCQKLQLWYRLACAWKKYKTERHACCPSTWHAEVEAEHHDGEERWRACRHADLLWFHLSSINRVFREWSEKVKISSEQQFSEQKTLYPVWRQS